MEKAVSIRQLLPDEKELTLVIAHWFHAEWGTPIHKTLQRVAYQPNAGMLFQLILIKEGKLAATGALCEDVNILKFHPKLRKFGPWIAMLYTHEPYRKQGLGAALLHQIETRAKQQGLSKLYLYTYTAESLYRRCGWQEIDRVEYDNHETIVMEKEI